MNAPVLLMYGERDVLRLGEQRALAGIKGATLKVIEDAPPEGQATGAAHEYKPDQFITSALNFLLDTR